MFLKTSIILCFVATFSQTSATTSFVEFKIIILILLPLTTWKNSHFWCKIKTPKSLHGQQNRVVYESGFPNLIHLLCMLSSRTYLHFMYINVCRHVGICVGMHAFASAHRYKYAWVCMITHVFKCMLQHVIILPLIAIHVILFCFYLHLCNFT